MDSRSLWQKRLACLTEIPCYKELQRVCCLSRKYSTQCTSLIRSHWGSYRHPLPSDPNYWLEFAGHPQRRRLQKNSSKIDPNMSWEMHTKELLSRFDGIEFKDLDGQWKISSIPSPLRYFFWFSLFPNNNQRDHIRQRANPLARGKVSFFVQHLDLLAALCKLCNYVFITYSCWTWSAVVGEIWWSLV